MDPAIENFTVRGAIYLWKYLSKENSYPGWNMTADKAGCDSLLYLLSMMDRSDHPSKRSLKTEIPTKQVAVANETSPFKTKQLLTFTHVKEKSNLWIIEEREKELIIAFDRKKLMELNDAIEKVKVRQGDFAIFDDHNENILSFWWPL